MWAGMVLYVTKRPEYFFSYEVQAYGRDHTLIKQKYEYELMHGKKNVFASLRTKLTHNGSFRLQLTHNCLYHPNSSSVTNFVSHISVPDISINMRLSMKIKTSNPHRLYPWMHSMITAATLSLCSSRQDLIFSRSRNPSNSPVLGLVFIGIGLSSAYSFPAPDPRSEPVGNNLQLPGRHNPLQEFVFD